MGVVPVQDLGPYPANCTDTSWKAAKTPGNRDKWHTELGAALRAAQVAYNKVKIEQLDLNLFMQAKGVRFDILKDIDIAKTAAMQHYNITAKPAIKALDLAISRAKTARLNPIISSAARAKADQIANTLTVRRNQLKAFHLRDFAQKRADVVRNQQYAFNGFDRKLQSALDDADEFIDRVRDNPTPQEFNEGIGPAARGITQCIGQVERMKKNGLDLGKDARRATALFDLLDPWANDKVKVDDDANALAVRAKRTEFANLVRQVKRWWA